MIKNTTLMPRAVYLVIMLGFVIVLGQLGSLVYFNYLISKTPTKCQSRVLEAASIASIANATGQSPGEARKIGLEYSVDKNVCID
jgi:flagellar basal body-associated protein FliL